VVEAELPGSLARAGLDPVAVQAAHARLVWLSITGYGPDDPRSAVEPTDLTLLAEGGPVWSCGYDDHALPPVRGGGGQAFHIGAHYAVMSLLTALLYREHSGQGQRIDVNLYAAANVTTEFASYSWLVASETVQRQTGRHAMPAMTNPTQGPSGDGGWVNTGVPPRTGPEFVSLIGWLEELGLADSFEGIGVLQLGTEVERIDLQLIAEDPLIGEIFQAGRDAQFFIASRIGGHEFFVGAQQRGMAAGVVYSPEDVLTDPQFVARDWPTPVHHPELDRTITYPGAPIRFERSPWAISRRAPLLGEHDDVVFGDGDVRFPLVGQIPSV
jgi:benzylsuccinate CoA-transferase BbsE subunit